MSKKSPARINIYVDDPAIRKSVRLAAAERSTSISEYCLDAIREKLDREEDVKAGEASMKQAIRNARRFQARIFGKKILSVSSAQLIRQARILRSGK